MSPPGREKSRPAADSFRKQAEACQLKAERAIDPMDGQLWSLLANQWCQLAQYVSSALLN
jgi:hypothetical protein